MKLTRRKNYFLVTLDRGDISRFNAEQNTRLPFEHAQFTFAKDNRRCIRVLPHDLQKGDMAWERLRDAARNFARGQNFNGYRT